MEVVPPDDTSTGSYFSIHNHPLNDIPYPSINDLRLLLTRSWEDYAVITTKSRIWIMKCANDISIDNQIAFFKYDKFINNSKRKYSNELELEKYFYSNESYIIKLINDVGVNIYSFRVWGVLNG